MQVPWGSDVGFMEVSCRFRCFLCLTVVAWRLPTDAVFMEVPCRLPLSALVGFIMYSD